MPDLRLKFYTRIEEFAPYFTFRVVKNQCDSKRNLKKTYFAINSFIAAIG